MKSKGLYIAHLSIHGFIRGKNPELGRDSDTGGQITYVLDLVKELAKNPDVEMVHLITRKIVGDDPSYEQDIEQLDDEGKCFIVRVECAESKYMRKEKLWTHIFEFLDNTIRVTKHLAGREPDLIHAHYPDAGRVAMYWSSITGIPFIFTGHSLGKDKISSLISEGVDLIQAEREFNLGYRVLTEEKVLQTAKAIVASTKHEKCVQYTQYTNFDPEKCIIIPPGVSLQAFSPPDKFFQDPPYIQELKRFLEKPTLPCILAIARATTKKNIKTIVKVYGKSKELQEKANLILLIGNRDKISDMEESESAEVLKELLVLIDDYDLYNHVAYPKKHTHKDVVDLYRYAAKTGGVFVNIAHFEPFGLTILEATASGVPIVATNKGGPYDVITQLNNGFLVDPCNKKDITTSLLTLLNDKEKWETFSKNGLKNIDKFSWKGHVQNYMNVVKRVIGENPTQNKLSLQYYVPKLKSTSFLVSSLDALLCNEKNHGCNEVLEILKKNNLSLGIATTRNITEALKIIGDKFYSEFIISSCGTEISYKMGDVKDKIYAKHIDWNWNKKNVREVLKDFNYLIHDSKHREKFRVRYTIDWNAVGEFSHPKLKEIINNIEQKFTSTSTVARVVHHNKHIIDIIPIRAGKGMALRYLLHRWNVPLNQVVTSGVSGGDTDILQGETMGIVVKNHSVELLCNWIRDSEKIYFAGKEHGWGIIEGLKHYGFN